MAKITDAIPFLPRELAVKLLAGIFGALVAVGLGLGFLDPNNRLLYGEKLIQQSYNLLFKRKAPVLIQEVCMVYMDDLSHRELKQPYNRSWDRGVHAQLLRKLKADGAKAVAFDIVFNDAHPTLPAGDEQLAKALKDFGPVVLGAEFVRNPLTGEETFTRAYDPFVDAASEKGKPIGIVQVYSEQDFMIRKHLHAPPSTNDYSFSSISWELANLLGAPLTQELTNRLTERYINYYGPPGTIPFISYYQALQQPPGFFTNTIVFVGANFPTKFSGERKDEYITPYTRKGQYVPGVDVQATQFINLLRGDWLRRSPPYAESMFILAAGLLLGLGLIFMRPFVALLAAVVIAAAVTFIAYFLFLKHLIWFPWLIIVAIQIPIAALWSFGYNSFRLYIQSRLLAQSLSSYVSPARVKQLLKQPDILKPGAEKQTLSILFSDIAGFTTISEGMDSDDLAQLMNNYFENAVSRIHETDGTVIKFIGDAIFAVWNAPLPQADHQVRAARGGLLLSQAVDSMITASKGPALITRIGLHTGVANVGNFGSTARFDYTAIGENINLASRMEGLNKYLGTTVLATRDTYVAAEQALLWRPLGRFRLKGFEKSFVEVYELLGETSQAEATKPWREPFAAALAEFQKRNFEAAEAGFKHILEIRPKDGPAKFFLKTLEEMRHHPPDDGWQGEIELKEK